MKKYFLIIKEKLEKIPFFKGFLHTTTIVAGSVEIRSAFKIALDPRNPKILRTAGFVKGSCCTVSLVSAYFAKAVPEPRVARAFHICCAVSGAGYVIAGGNNATYLAILAVANNTSLPGLPGK
jgi:hypothetical protein